jgi:hypothetical protein
LQDEKGEVSNNKDNKWQNVDFSAGCSSVYL